MKTRIFPKWLTQKLLNHLFMWEISTKTVRYIDGWGIDYEYKEKHMVRHKIFRGCGVVLNFKPEQKDIEYYALDWLTNTKWLKKK